MKGEIDLSRTGYFDYLIRQDELTGERFVQDPGVLAEPAKETLIVKPTIPVAATSEKL